jgi:hypothetical protein
MGFAVAVNSLTHVVLSVVAEFLWNQVMFKLR